MISHPSGLDPLEIFPVLGPALLLLPALACYTLARRLWGWPYGVAAALFAGILNGGTYYFNDAMYPNRLTAFPIRGAIARARRSLRRASSGEESRWRGRLLLFLPSGGDPDEAALLVLVLD